MTDRPNRNAVVPCSPCLGSIFNQNEIMLIGKQLEGGHVTRVTGEMHSDDWRAFLG